MKLELVLTSLLSTSAFSEQDNIDVLQVTSSRGVTGHFFSELRAGCCQADNHLVLSNGSVDSLDDCKQRCSNLPNCFFINHGVDRGSRTQVCILMSDNAKCRADAFNKTAITCGPTLSNMDLVRVYAYNRRQRNMCVDGHIVPELFLIGAQKAATSTLAMSLVRNTQLRFGAQFNDTTIGAKLSLGKEAHVFDALAFNQTQLNVGLWAQHYPLCEDMMERLVMFDATPDYLRMGMGYMRKFYGGMGTNIKFLVTLRDPLARMQSWFYHATASSDGWWNFGGSFHNYIHEILNGQDEEDVGLKQGYLGSEYASSLVRWVSAGFFPSQFTILNMADLIEPSSLEKLSQHIWQILDIDSAHGIGDLQSTSLVGLNHHEHPSLDEDIPSDLRQNLEGFMVANMNLTISKILPAVVELAPTATNIGLTAAVLAQGFNLYGFLESKDTARVERQRQASAKVESIAAWLAEKWALA